MILCSKLKNGLCKIVTKSQVVTISRLRCPLSDFLRYANSKERKLKDFLDS